MTGGFGIHGSYPAGPLQLEQIKITPEHHHRIGQTTSRDNRKVL
jgi:hypothetical protein